MLEIRKSRLARTSRLDHVAVCQHLRTVSLSAFKLYGTIDNGLLVFIRRLAHSEPAFCWLKRQKRQPVPKSGDSATEHSAFLSRRESILNLKHHSSSQACQNIFNIISTCEEEYQHTTRDPAFHRSFRSRREEPGVRSTAKSRRKTHGTFKRHEHSTTIGTSAKLECKLSFQRLRSVQPPVAVPQDAFAAHEQGSGLADKVGKHGYLHYHGT